MSKFFVVVISVMIVLGLMCVPGRAELLEIDLVPGSGDGLLTLDTDTGLEWLDLTATSDPAGQSYNAVAAGFGGFTTEQGFRFATVSEVLILFDNAGVIALNTGFVSANFAPVSQLIGLLGCTGEPRTSQDCESGDFPVSIGFADFDIFDPISAADFSLQLDIPGSRGRASGPFSLQKSISIFNAGAFLVRSSILSVDIDIKPGDSDLNCIKASSQGLMPVAILGNGIDVNDIDVSTIEIDDDDDDPDTIGVAPVQSSFKDVNSDLVTDLVFHFETPALNTEGLLVEGNELFVTGELTDGTPIVGSDFISLAGGPSCFD